jgi:XRE family transcriptional regulator, regulator of sulfur utilization
MSESKKSTVKSVQRGRPRGTKTFDPGIAKTFGLVVREKRTALGLAQEQLALLSNTDRSFVGKVERGENQPSLVLILRLAKALGCSAGDLVAEVESRRRV